MAFTPAEKSSIRQWMGYADIFHDADPTLENSIKAVEALPDSGVAEARIRAMLPRIQVTWDKFTDLDCLSTVSVGNVVIDGMRAAAWAGAVGFKQVGMLADALSCSIARNIFASPKTVPRSGPFGGASRLGGWPPQ